MLHNKTWFFDLDPLLKNASRAPVQQRLGVKCLLYLISVLNFAIILQLLAVYCVGLTYIGALLYCGITWDMRSDIVWLLITQ